jgi:hypothetical protein
MYILTNVNLKAGTCNVFDTEDKKVDNVSLYKTSDLVRNRRTRIYGIIPLTRTTYNNSVQPIRQLGIGIDNVEAKQALATYYMNCGLNKEQALKKAGL